MTTVSLVCCAAVIACILLFSGKSLFLELLLSLHWFYTRHYCKYRKLLICILSLSISIPISPLSKIKGTFAAAASSWSVKKLVRLFQAYHFHFYSIYRIFNSWSSCFSKLLSYHFQHLFAVPMMYSSFPTLLHEIKTTAAESNKIICFI
jgi:hypothetical protein